ncbi:hypothetical protein CJ485_25330 [Priestia filamentosa]|nr:hypothetical protein CJ485_25330 [Priestia filamentosa]
MKECLLYISVFKDGTMEKRHIIKGNYLMYYTQMASAIRTGENAEITKEDVAKVLKYLEKIQNK